MVSKEHGAPKTARPRALGAHSRQLNGHTKSITGCSLSADGTRALTCSSDKTARLWDLSDGGKQLLKHLLAAGRHAGTASRTACWHGGTAARRHGGTAPPSGAGMMALSHVAEVKHELSEHDDDKALRTHGPCAVTQGPYACMLAQQAARAAGHAPDDRPAKRRRSGPSSPPAEPRGVQRAAAAAAEAAPAPAPATQGELAALRAQLDAAMQALGVAQATLASIVARQAA